jgi:hypothetical protein
MATANYDCVLRLSQIRLEGGASWGRADRKADWPKSQLMHYKNGREAREGDFVIHRDGEKVIAGRIHSLQPKAQTCNGLIAMTVQGSVSQQYVTVGDCLHAEDAWSCYDACMSDPDLSASTLAITS